VTDSGFAREMDHVWQTISDIDGSGDFLTAQFRYASHSLTQQNREVSTPSPAVDTSEVSLPAPATVFPSVPE